MSSNNEQYLLAEAIFACARISPESLKLETTCSPDLIHVSSRCSLLSVSSVKHQLTFMISSVSSLNLPSITSEYFATNSLHNLNIGSYFCQSFVERRSGLIFLFKNSSKKRNFLKSLNLSITKNSSLKGS